MSLFQPVDFTNADKMIDYHLLNTSKIATTLEKITVLKCVHLSSIYNHDPGYVPE